MAFLGFLFIFIFIVLIPGIYHMHIIVRIEMGTEGYSYAMIPSFDS